MYLQHSCGEHQIHISNGHLIVNNTQLIGRLLLTSIPYNSACLSNLPSVQFCPEIHDTVYDFISRKLVSKTAFFNATIGYDGKDQFQDNFTCSRRKLETREMVR